MPKCVLLNADYSFLNIVPWKRAMSMMSKGKVQVLKNSEKIIRTAEGMVIKVPAVMKLVKYIRTLFQNKVPFNKKNVLLRDGFKCAYCGLYKDRLTIDHVIPKSRGGKTIFENCVSACKPCNNKKGGNTPSEAKMYPRVKMFQPTISEFIRLKAKSLGIIDMLKNYEIY